MGLGTRLCRTYQAFYSALLQCHALCGVRLPKSEENCAFFYRESWWLHHFLYCPLTEGPKTPPLPAAGVVLEGGGDREGGGEIMEQSGGADDTHKLTDDNLSSVSDTSLASCSGDEGVGPRTPPTEPNESSLINMSDVSSDLDDGERALMSSQEDAPGNQAEKPGGDGVSSQPEEKDTVVSANQPESGGDAPGKQPIATAMEETAADSEDVLKSADSAELSGMLSSDTVAVENANVLPGEDVPHPLLSETASQQGSAPPSPTAVGTPTKTPGKRKVRKNCIISLHFSYIDVQKMT